MSDTITLPETGVVRVGDVPVVAANITVREPFTRPGGPVAPTAQLHVGETETLEVQQGDEVELGGARFLVAEVVEDPAHGRGHVKLAARR